MSGLGGISSKFDTLDDAYEAGYQEGFNAGQADGYNEGHRAGRFSAGSDPALIEALGDLLNWDVEHDHPALSYITVQVDRDVINKAAAAWEAAQR